MMTRLAPSTRGTIRHLLTLQKSQIIYSGRRNGRHRCVDSTEEVKTMTRSAPSARSRASATSGLSAPAHTTLYSRSSRGSAYLVTRRCWSHEQQHQHHNCFKERFHPGQSAAGA